MIAVGCLTLKRVWVQDLAPTRAALVHFLWDSWMPTDRYDREFDSVAAASQRGSSWPREEEPERKTQALPLRQRPKEGV